MNEKKIFEFKITKKYPALICLFVLLSFLTFIEFILIKGAFKKTSEVLVPILILTIYLTSVYRTFFWYLFGKEHIEITQQNLIISKKGTFLVKSKTYNCLQMKNLRFEQRKFSFLDFFASRTSTINLKSYGCIVFTFENKTINFGENIDSKVAGEIMVILKTNLKNAYR